MKIRRDQTTTSSKGQVRRDITVEGANAEEAQRLGRAGKAQRPDVKFKRGGSVEHNEDGSITVTTTGDLRES